MSEQVRDAPRRSGQDAQIMHGQKFQDVVEHAGLREGRPF
jgi:hypothetical protein